MTVDPTEYLAAEAISAGEYERALAILLPIAETGSEYALLSLGWLYESGKVSSPNTNDARTQYERAMATGSASACFYLGRLLERVGEEEAARRTFEVGAKLGNRDCAIELKRVLDANVEQQAAGAIAVGKFDEAVRLLQPLADRGSQYALSTLGWVYETGAVGDTDWDKASFYYERAAAEGSPVACFDLGRLALRRQKEDLARTAFETGAKRGDVASMTRLGKMMIEGRGGPIDHDGGLSWLKSAAEQGSITAQRMLLAIEELNARSFAEKLSIRAKIAHLALRGAGEMLNDPESPCVR